MQGGYKWVPAILMICGAAQGSSTESAYSQLEAGLRQQVELLSLVVDEGSASAHLPALRQSVDFLLALNKSVNVSDLWHYIDNTEGVAQPLIDLVQALAVQFQRLEKMDFYGNSDLKALFSDQLYPVSESE